MKKYNAFFIAILLWLTIVNSVIAALGPNLSPDPSFEQRETYVNQQKAVFDESVVRTGNLSLRLDGDPDTNVTCNTTYLPLVNGQEYLIKVWIKVKGTPTVQVGMRSVTAANVSYTYTWRTVSVPVQDEWFEYETRISTPTNRSAVNFHIYFQIVKSSGQAWFDDFSIQEDDSLPPNSPRNLAADRFSNGIKLSWIEPEMAADSDIAEGGYKVFRSTIQSDLGAPETLVKHVINNGYFDVFGDRYPYYYSVIALDNLLNESAPTIIYLPGVGSLSGYISDDKGDPIPNATIKIGDSLTTSDNSGFYRFEILIEGSREIKLSKPGYKWVVDIVNISSNQDSAQNFSLKSDRKLPLEPEELTATPGEGYINLKWLPPIFLGDKVIAGYNVYRASTQEVSANQKNQVAYLIEDIQWNDIEVIPQQGYWYFVTVVDDAYNESKASNLAFGIPLNPSKVSSSKPSGETFLDEPIVFEWESLDNVDYYLIELSQDKNFPIEKTTIIDTRSNFNNYTYRRIVRYTDEGKEETIEIGLPDGEWYWRVLAIFKNGVKSRPSDHFKISCFNTKIWIEDATPKEYNIGALQNAQTLPIPYFQIKPPILTKDNPKTTIEFAIGSQGIAQGEVRVLNSAGKKVASLFNGELVPNVKFELDWYGRDTNNRDLNNGLYIIQVVFLSGKQSTLAVKKVVIFR